MGHDKHTQLGTDLSQDDRTPITDPSERDALWDSVQTQEEVEQEWSDLVKDAESKGMTTEEYARQFQ